MGIGKVQKVTFFIAAITFLLGLFLLLIGWFSEENKIAGAYYNELIYYLDGYYDRKVLKAGGQVEFEKFYKYSDDYVKNYCSNDKCKATDKICNSYCSMYKTLSAIRIITILYLIFVGNIFLSQLITLSMEKARCGSKKCMQIMFIILISTLLLSFIALLISSILVYSQWNDHKNYLITFEYGVVFVPIMSFINCGNLSILSGILIYQYIFFRRIQGDSDFAIADSANSKRNLLV